MRAAMRFRKMQRRIVARAVCCAASSSAGINWVVWVAELRVRLENKSCGVDVTCQTAEHLNAKRFEGSDDE